MARDQVQTNQRATRPRRKGAQQRSAAIAAAKTPPAGKTAPAGKSAIEQDHEPPIVRWIRVAVPVPVGVHVPAPRLRLPHVDLPSPATAAARQTAHAVGMVRGRVPVPRRLVYYGALGVMAAVGALEWPVAAAIGAGVWVTGRTVQRSGPSEGARAETGAAPTSRMR
jgi:hypothetical protein